MAYGEIKAYRDIGPKCHKQCLTSYEIIIIFSVIIRGLKMNNGVYYDQNQLDILSNEL